VTAYVAFLDVVAKVFLGLGVLAGGICVLDWAVRTRKVNPFSAIARVHRRTTDPLLRPIEARVVRMGGQPAAAPLWAFVGVAVLGIVVIQLLRILGGLIAEAMIVADYPSRIPFLLAGWALQFLYIALLVRVISTWLPISPYSKWIRWSYTATEWLLAPLRRVIPPMGAFDLSPLAALVLIWIVRGLIT
jgi:YggT family protein